jgi:long-chain acyl-CoA synthetase
MSRFISQVVLCGANKPYNVALIVPDWKAIRSELKISDDVTEENLVNYKTVKALIDNEVKAKCKNLKKYEVPHFWSFVAPFTQANNMLTPKMSIRRHEVIRVYEDVIGSLYESDIKSVSFNDLERQENVA